MIAVFAGNTMAEGSRGDKIIRGRGARNFYRADLDRIRGFGAGST